MMYFDLRPGQGVAIEKGKVVITLESRSGNVARLCIQAPPEIDVKRIEKPLTGGRLAQGGLTPQK